MRFFFDVGGIRDANGVALHEVDFRDEQPSDAYSRCPFSDVRRSKLMNAVAFARMSKSWEDITLQADAITSIFKSDDQDLSDLRDFWRIASSFMYIPLYFYRKQGVGDDFRLNVVTADLFKAMLDVPTTIDLMLADTASKGGDFRLNNLPKALYDFANDHELLVNGSYVCAGPKNLIEQIANRICSRSNLTNLDVQEAFPEIDIGEFRRFVEICNSRYAVAQIFQCAMMLFNESVQCQFGTYSNLEFTFENSAYETRRRFLLATLTGREKYLSFVDAYEGAVRGVNTRGGLGGCQYNSIFSSAMIKLREFGDILEIQRDVEIFGYFERLTEEVNDLVQAYEKAVIEDFGFAPLGGSGMPVKNGPLQIARFIY